ncbi:glutaminyl-peptide cyclotransferase [Sodiomyces alkalinus F11]|uniref:Peptide hydrolase n=1 Tax=Sodiomyces alkalinus (strain CBS 110278 / VKM F-3762 / F11) TaxID=1314773 RepID=A0A3N2Q3H5_SODAK|nr:glutaminyl-peptide cyclotransferase [Sodiomyces alkalinus F11]ROT41321.1 glutaminyl-peptide cyclotransferase [Sodiomyces alkalinus F11]
MLLIRLLSLASSALAYQKLSDDWLKNVTSGGDDFDVHNGALLAPLLITRVPGTPGQTKVQQHFVNYFSTQLPSWTVEWQNSTDKTPKTGDRDIPFQNLIIRREPPWTRTRPGQANYLTFAAHYDSKLEPKGFIGATDSAAPCAMLMHLARSIDRRLTERYDKLNSNGEPGGTMSSDMGVQILLLDGEEAFDRWTATDSVYGSRSLSQEWENTFNPAMSSYKTPLDQISIFVLLDLLGSANPSIPSYFRTTHWAYKNMATIESRMRGLGLLESDSEGPFLPDGEIDAKELGTTYIGDDHEPFMHKGVPILHMIPAPFPMVWHTMDDDGDHLHMPTVRDWSKIVTAFAMEWLDLMELEPSSGQGRRI